MEGDESCRELSSRDRPRDGLDLALLGDDLACDDKDDFVVNEEDDDDLDDGNDDEEEDGAQSLDSDTDLQLKVLLELANQKRVLT